MRKRAWNPTRSAQFEAMRNFKFYYYQWVVLLHSDHLNSGVWQKNPLFYSYTHLQTFIAGSLTAHQTKISMPLSHRNRIPKDAVDEYIIILLFGIHSILTYWYVKASKLESFMRFWLHHLSASLNIIASRNIMNGANGTVFIWNDVIDLKMMSYRIWSFRL